MISLYYAPDNASLIVRITLEELGLPYTTILVDRRTQAQHSAEYLTLNPNGLIPVCIINDQPVFETAAIVLALADEHKGLHVPIGDQRRPQFLKWLFFLSNSLHGDLRQHFYPEKYIGHEPQALTSFSNMTLKRLIERFTIIESQYAKTTTDYLFGPEATIVDIYLAVCLRWVQLYPKDASKQITSRQYPAINTMVRKLQTRKALRAACAKEGISGAMFSDPTYAEPTEGVAT